MFPYYLGLALSVAAAVVCVKRGQSQPWLWIILFFPGIGAVIYFLSEVVPTRSLRSLTGSKATKRELNHAEAEVRRLDNSESWTNYAQALRSRKQYTDAQQAAESAVSRDEGNARALYELGLAFMGLERHGEAAETLSRLVEHEPNHASGDAQYALAVALEKSGQKEVARTHLEELASKSSLPKVLYSLAALQADAGETSSARASLERIIDEAEYVPSYHKREVRPWVRKARKALTSLPSST